MIPASLPLFDVAAGEKAKERGRRRAELCRQPLLTILREALRNKALARRDRLATADDAYAALAEMGKPAESLGNSAGSLFRGNEWEGTALWVKSKRRSNHARMVRVWRLR